MAKGTEASPIVDSGPRNRTIHFDLAESDLEGLALGDEVTIIVKAKVKGVSAPYEYTDEKGKVHKDKYGDVRFKVLGHEFRKETEFSKLMDDEG